MKEMKQMLLGIITSTLAILPSCKEEVICGLECKEEDKCDPECSYEADGEFFKQEQLQEIKGCTEVSTELGVMTAEFEEIDEMECLEVVQAGISIRANSYLKNIEGLRNIETVGYHLIVEGNPQLTNLDGLRSLKSIGKIAENIGDIDHVLGNGHIEIKNNLILDDIRGLYQLEYLFKGLHIENNPNLPTCQAMELKSRLEDIGWNGESVICGNLADECGSESCDDGSDAGI